MIRQFDDMANQLHCATDKLPAWVSGKPSDGTPPSLGTYAAYEAKLEGKSQKMKRRRIR
jgi:hypothetical protein